MDDSLTLLHQLTWRSRLYSFWHRLILWLTGIRYAAQLLRLVHLNIRVLQHFRRCREVEHLYPERFSRFWHLSFYRETFCQCLRLFAPLRFPLPSGGEERPGSPRRGKKKKRGQPGGPQKTASCHEHFHQQPSRLPPIVSFPELAWELRLSSAALMQNPQEQPPRKRWRLRLAIRTWLLSLGHFPSSCVAKCRSLLRLKTYALQQRQFYQQAQLTLLQEQQRMAISTQTALFLSFATAIDLKTARELTAVGQLVGKQRQQQTMTAEDLACFDQSLNTLDSNHASLRMAVQ